MRFRGFSWVLSGGESMSGESTKSLVLKLLTPAATLEQRRESAMEVYRAVHGSDPSEEELTRLQDMAARYGATFDNARQENPASS